MSAQPHTSVGTTAPRELERCSECGRVLVLSNDQLVCGYRFCGEYGRTVNDDEPTEERDA